MNYLKTKRICRTIEHYPLYSLDLFGTQCSDYPHWAPIHAFANYKTNVTSEQIWNELGDVKFSLSLIGRQPLELLVGFFN